MIIRKATVDDAKATCDVIRASILEVGWPPYAEKYDVPEALDVWMENKTPENVKKWIEDIGNLFLVCQDEERILGVSCISKIKADILLFFVSPQAQGLGVGASLMNALVESMRQLGHTELNVVSTIGAKTFYERHGFVKVGETKGTHPDIVVPILKKKLD